MAETLAYFLTWTTHGTRLHGDAEGSTDRGRPAIGPQPLEANPAREARARRRMTSPSIVLDPTARGVVDQAFRDHATYRGWAILALNVRSNHVHMIVDARRGLARPSPERVMQELKSWATRRLREDGRVSADQRVWTRHGSTRWIKRQEDLESAVDYVRRLQDGPRFDARR